MRLLLVLFALALSAGGPSAQPFTRITDAGNPVVTDAKDSGGAVWADFDDDGDLDLFVANQNAEPNFLYRNDRTGGNWLQVDLRGQAPNTTGTGARVAVRALIGGTERVQWGEVLP